MANETSDRPRLTPKGARTRARIVEEAAALTPGLESPTVSPLRDSDWVAVRSMVLKKSTNQVMDELYDLGARAILVSSIHACRI